MEIYEGACVKVLSLPDGFGTAMMQNEDGRWLVDLDNLEPGIFPADELEVVECPDEDEDEKEDWDYEPEYNDED